MSSASRASWARRLAVGVTGALVLAAVAQSAPSTASAAWFDQPLPASEHAFGPVAVTAHATSPGGIEQIELLVDGSSVETADFAGAPVLAQAEFEWLPPADGVYWFVVRGRTGGQWGPSAALLVKIGQTDFLLSPAATIVTSPVPTQSGSSEPGPTVSSPTARPATTPTARPTPTLRPTPRPTARPTPTVRPSATPTRPPPPTPAPPCTPRAPTLVEPHDFYFLDDPALNPPTFRWTDESTEDCVAAGFRIQVARTAQFGSSTVVQGNVGNTRVHEWTPPDALPDCQEGPYYWRVRPKRADGSLGPPSDVWQLFVSTFACDRQ